LADAVEMSSVTALSAILVIRHVYATAPSFDGGLCTLIFRHSETITSDGECEWLLGVKTGSSRGANDWQ
jgi:hypothetical protein